MILGVLAGLGASFVWAAAPLMAHRPAQSLGAFEFTRIQLISSFAVLLAIVTLTIGWANVATEHALAYIISSLFSVVLGNLALVACLRLGGPQRMEMLFALNSPIAACLGYLLLRETLMPIQVTGIGIGVAGVMVAILSSNHQVSKREGNQALPRANLNRIILLGLAAATCNAIGLIALRPIMTSGTEPLTATAIRTGGAALIVTVAALWPMRIFQPKTERTLSLTIATIVPGILGYVVAVSLQLYALKIFGIGTAALLGSASPVMILPLIWIFKKERPHLSAWIGAIMVVIGTGLSIPE
jgi:drug/metabolite transporter (DMT)-like permease